jgi:hypothetical protein
MRVSGVELLDQQPEEPWPSGTLLQRGATTRASCVPPPIPRSRPRSRIFGAPQLGCSLHNEFLDLEWPPADKDVETGRSVPPSHMLCSKRRFCSLFNILLSGRL